MQSLASYMTANRACAHQQYAAGSGEKLGVCHQRIAIPLADHLPDILEGLEKKAYLCYMTNAD